MSKSLTTTSKIPRVGPPGFPPIHPGEFLREEYMLPLGLSAAAVARDIGKPANLVTAILNETRGITAETAMLLAAYFDTRPEFWMGLQQAYELAKARQDKATLSKIGRVQKYSAIASKQARRPSTKGKAA